MFLPLLFKHPITRQRPLKALFRYGSWHLSHKGRDKRGVFRLLGETKIYLSKDDSASLVNYYTGLYEFEEMCFLLHFLRQGDLLVDAGANVGVFSLLAAGHNRCNCVSFEPVPTTFYRFQQNIELNKLAGLITAVNAGLGSACGSLKFTSQLENSVNRVAQNDDEDVVDVQVQTLDDSIADVNKYEAILLKVDVEGFETEVLRGADTFLRNKRLKAIIIELNGSGERYGFEEETLKRRLLDEGFRLWFYEPFSRCLSQRPPSNNWGNAIYVRDEVMVRDRLLSAKQIDVWGCTI